MSTKKLHTNSRSVKSSGIDTIMMRRAPATAAATDARTPAHALTLSAPLDDEPPDAVPVADAAEPDGEVAEADEADAADDADDAPEADDADDAVDSPEADDAADEATLALTEDADDAALALTEEADATEEVDAIEDVAEAVPEVAVEAWSYGQNPSRLAVKRVAYHQSRQAVFGRVALDVELVEHGLARGVGAEAHDAVDAVLELVGVGLRAHALGASASGGTAVVERGVDGAAIVGALRRDGGDVVVARN
ncbi:hypothetical protein HWV62_20258 [Athelia sp. TMB]|nr:hypothetical protein HWV62_20258 [Athelia sp. TMB]